MKVRIGIDVGGTFTDAVAIDNETFEVVGSVKVPTTHTAAEGVAAGIVQVLHKVMEQCKIRPEDVIFIAHGTTQAMNLKTYRCTCTVGRSRYSLFDFSYENLTNYRPVAVTCNSYAECKDCKIGGFCGGGCQLSHQIDFKKCCTYEEEVFSHFMKTLFIPYIKSKYNEVNQNERKAENRCT